MIHGCAHWILTPHLHSDSLTCLFLLFFESNMAAFRSWMSSGPSMPASLVVKCWNESQRLRAESETFSAAVRETLSTSGAPGRDGKGSGTLTTKVPWKNRNIRTPSCYTSVCLLAAASYCSFMYTPCQEGACMKPEESIRGMAKAAGVWGFKKCFIEGANFLSWTRGLNKNL